jgi:formyl-CoA transferase
VLEKLIKESDVLVENFGPGALDRMGFSWERIQELNPKMIVASVKGFSDGHHYEDLQGLRERRAVRRRRRLDHRLRRRPADWSPARARRQQHRHAPGHRHRHRAVSAQQTGKGQKVACRHAGRRAQPVPREAARPAAPGPHGYLEEYPQYPHGPSATPCRAAAMPAAAASRAGS